MGFRVQVLGFSHLTRSAVVQGFPYQGGFTYEEMTAVIDQFAAPFMEGFDGGAGANSTYTLHPTPYTLHPTPYSLHPTPYTLHPTPYTVTAYPARAPSLECRRGFIATSRQRERDGLRQVLLCCSCRQDHARLRQQPRPVCGRREAHAEPEVRPASSLSFL